ncbi:alpha subunit of gdp-forming succinate-CoA ligase [Tirmania nivea]|nr:alpha subunit of gdp-forming succinate-CoA ligase [Tirmania nivea]
MPCFSEHPSTIKNLVVGGHTRVMFQDFTATVNATQSIEYGTNVVGCVSPNKSGQHLGLPVYSTVREAVRYLKPDATIIFVPAAHATSAIFEAIEAEISLISAVAEHIPVHETSKSRLLGPNSPGLLHAPSCCRDGFMPYPQFTPDYVIGLREALEMVWEDKNTEGVVVIGEVGGGDGELEVAEFVGEKRDKGEPMNTNTDWVDLRRHIVGLIAGIAAPSNRTMGHSGAFASSFMGDVSTEDKLKAFKHAGIESITHPGQAGAHETAFYYK